MTEERKNKKGIGVTARLVSITMVPIICILFTLSFIAISDMKDGMIKTLYDGMAGMAGSVQSAYDIVYQGDYTVDEKTGALKKGEVDLTPTNVMMDQMVEKSNYNMILTYGDEIKITTMTDKNKDRIIGKKFTDEDTKENVLKKGKDYKDSQTKIEGESYYTYTTPLKNTDGSIVGLVCITEPSEEIDDYIAGRVKIIIGFAIGLLLITLTTTTIVSKALAGAIKISEKALLDLSNGRINIQIEERFLNRKDEIGRMANALNDLQERLKQIISDIKDSSAVLLDSGENLSQMAQQSNIAADEISRAVEDISKGAVSQAEEIETASMQIGNMGEVIGEIVSGVGTLQQTSTEMKNVGDESTDIIGQLSESNDRTTKAIAHIGNQIQVTNDSVQAIGEAAKLITSIADQTSLLALNASIEAARAGEAGKGFAVVADEIGKLADQSTTSAVQIQEVIDHLLEESEKTVEVMEEVNVLVAEQQEKLNETRQKFVEVNKGIDSSREDTVAIESHTATCDSARVKVVDIIQNLSAISEENAASTEQTTASMQELNATINLLADASKNLTELSRKLDGEIGFFRFDDEQ